MAALDLLDEIEDDDASPTVEAIGMPQALNVTTGLLLLGQRLLLALPIRHGLLPPVEFARTLIDAGFIATGGQHLDLTTEGFTAVSPDEVLATARRKSGALVSAACRLGAMVGTVDEDLLDLYARWGAHYGTAGQLANDLHDALDTDLKSDVARQKSTLPLLFRKRLAIATEDLSSSGALHFTWVVVEIERQACRELTDELEARGQRIAQLRQFVP